MNCVSRATNKSLIWLSVRSGVGCILAVMVVIQKEGCYVLFPRHQPVILIVEHEIKLVMGQGIFRMKPSKYRLLYDDDLVIIK